MSSAPWSSRPKVDDLDLTDILQRRTPSQLTKNQEITISDLITFFYDAIVTLPNGEEIQMANAQVPFLNVGGVFRGRIIPNPDNQFNIRNQAQLEAEFGLDIIIPAGLNTKIVINAEFELTKPFRLGNGAGFQLEFSNIGPAINWTGPGAMIQNENPGNEAAFLIIQSVNVSGNTTNSFIDLAIADFGFSAIRSLNVDNLDSIGTISNSIIFLASLTGFTINKGLVLLECSRISLDNAVQGNFSATNTTWLSIINELVAGIVTIRDASASNFASGDSLIFFDPNPFAGTRSTISSSGITVFGLPGTFYQPGANIDIIEITDAAGIAVFRTSTTHNLVIGERIILKDFVTQIQYNTNHIVTAIPSTTSFETGALFVADDPTGVLTNRPIDVIAVTDTATKATFDTGTTPHGLVVGRPVVLKNFGVELSYNRTVIVTAVDMPLTGHFFDTDIDFVQDDFGLMDATSLTQKSTLVDAAKNVGSPDSKNIGSLVVNGNTVDTVIANQNEFTDLNLGGLAVEGSNIEQWIVTNPTTGEMQYIGLEDFNGVLNAVVVLEPNSVDIFDIHMVVNGIPTADTVSSRTGISQAGVTTPVVSIPFTSPLSVVTGDFVRLQVLNEDGTTNPTITDLSMGAQNP